MFLLGDFLYDRIFWIFLREKKYGLYFCSIVWIWIMLLAGFVMGSVCCNWIFILGKFSCGNFLSGLWQMKY